MTTVIYLQGARGRMGRTIVSLIQNDPNFSLRDELTACDVSIDFSVPAALSPLVTACIQAKKPLVVGTTGHGEEGKHLLTKASQHIPIFYTPNFSVGIALLEELVHKLAEKDRFGCVKTPGFSERKTSFISLIQRALRS